jgi:signal transduction histidine kinase/CheY-like chemotaxis protein
MPLLKAQARLNDSIAAEQIQAFFFETNAQNLVGAVVFSLMVYTVHDLVSPISWGPTLLVVYLATLGRALQIRQHRKTPALKTPDQWGNQHTLLSAINGLGWGIGNTAMASQLSNEYQIFIVGVASVCAVASVSEGFAYPNPSRAFVITSIAPLVLWLLTLQDRLHTVVALLVAILTTMILWQGEKRYQSFLKVLKLRFQHEHLSQELARQRDIAVQAVSSKSRFLSYASHDIRQPLQAMQIYLTLLKEELPPTGKMIDLMRRTEQSTHALNSLLNTLLDISKLDAGVLTPNLRHFRVHDLLSAMEKEFGMQARQHGLKLKFAAHQNALESDPELLSQLLRNLISNAIRYTRQGRILVTARTHQDMFQIRVHDTGIGIHESMHASIFDEFFQVGNKSRDRNQGLGLGLAISNRIAALLGYTLQVRSTLGKGSCFTICIPRKRIVALNAMTELPQNPADAPPTDLQGRNILLIENEEMIRSALRILLTQHGCQVLALSGYENIGSLLSKPMHIDIIISDIDLRDNLNGIDLISSLRTQHRIFCPTILMTGDTSKQSIEAASSRGFQLLHKPVKPEVLFSAIKESLSSQFEEPGKIPRRTPA